MRYLFVYQHFAIQARELVARTGATDVEVVLVKKGEDRPDDHLFGRLDTIKPMCATCQVVRGYRRAVEAVTTVEYCAKTFRVDDQQLIAWLQATKPAAAQAVICPTAAFRACVAQCDHLVLAAGALTRADETDRLRWPFIQRAANILTRKAQGEDLGPMREWKARHGVDYAAHSKVGFKGGPAQQKKTSSWHLKDGDHTTAEAAARVYFDCLERHGQSIVVVFYVGPHPPDKVYDWVFEGEE
ncbi:hypothetical protein ACVCL3_07250 [Rhodanobacter sp. UC4437_H4]